MSDPRVDRRTLLRAAAAGPLGAAVTGTAAAASGPLSLDCTLVSDAPVLPGETARVAVTVENETDSPAAAHLVYNGLPACCYFRGTCSAQIPPAPISHDNVVAHDDAGADYRPVMWSWDALPAGASRRVTVTFRLPKEAETVSVPFAAADLDHCSPGEDDTVAGSVTIPVERRSLDASFTISPSSPEAGERVAVDATGSTAPTSPVDAYRWDFDGDGDVEATGETATTTFDDPGEQPITLRVVEHGDSPDGVSAPPVRDADTATRTITVTEPSAVSVSPSPLDFGTTVAGETVEESLTFAASEAARVESVDGPPGVSADPNCDVNFLFFRYGCEPTPPLDVDAGAEASVSVSLDARAAGVVRDVDRSTTVATGDGETAVPTRWTVVASADTLADFAATARSFSRFFDTGISARRAAVGGDVLDMYESAFKLAGKRIGRQYRDALEEAKAMGEALEQADSDLNTKGFLSEWTGDMEINSGPSPIADRFETLAEQLASCEEDVSAGKPVEAAEHARTAVDTASAAAEKARAAYDELLAESTYHDDAERYLGDVVPAAEAFARTIAGGRTD